ncbi:MAG TPA: ComEC/Rec2 family competence protein, partial [Patescibacteria group bacterium]|nr:ComEC/Rec2 family competence protein [Patescibacteria group bacterium]
MSKSRVFVGLAAGFALGILMASHFAFSVPVLLAALAAALGAFALFAINRFGPGAFAALFLCAAALGALRLEAADRTSEYAGLLNQKQKLEGYIVEEPDVRENYQMLTVQPKGFGQNILVTTTFAQEYFYGDWVLLEGKLQEAKNFDDFDYQKYLQRYNIYAVERYPDVLVLKSRQLNPVKYGLLRLKGAFAARVGQLLPEPEASLLLGILIGARKTLPQQVVDNFNDTGTSHIIAVSGFNITIIISSLAAGAYLLGRRASFYLSLACLLAFVVIAGASASVVRAALMGLLLLAALNIGRQYAIVPALFFAALLMLLQNPKILFWDVGFQLSFAATLGIIYFLPVLQKTAEHWPELWGIKTLLLTTLAAIAATLPLILYTFGRLSLSAPLANILVLPAVPLTMLLGFLTVLPLAGPGFALLARWLLAYILKVIAVLAALP